MFRKPFTLAVRGMHYGLYGKDAESERLGAMYVGDYGPGTLWFPA